MMKNEVCPLAKIAQIIQKRDSFPAFEMTPHTIPQHQPFLTVSFQKSLSIRSSTILGTTTYHVTFIREDGTILKEAYGLSCIQVLDHIVTYFHINDPGWKTRTRFYAKCKRILKKCFPTMHIEEDIKDDYHILRLLNVTIPTLTPALWIDSHEMILEFGHITHTHFDHITSPATGSWENTCYVLIRDTLEYLSDFINGKIIIYEALNNNQYIGGGSFHQDYYSGDTMKIFSSQSAQSQKKSLTRKKVYYNVYGLLEKQDITS